MEAGADPGLEDSEGKLAADLVAPQGAAQLAELLAAKPSGRAKAGTKKAGRQPSPSKSAQQQFIDLPQVSWLIWCVLLAEQVPGLHISGFTLCCKA